jgi:CRP/FNR family transcriptional regulator
MRSLNHCEPCLFNEICPSSSCRQVETKIPFSQRILKRHQLFHINPRLSQNFYFIRTGSLKTCSFDAKGKEQIRAFYYPGNLLNLEKPADLFIYATSNTEICALDLEAIIEYCSKNPGFFYKILQAQNRQLHDYQHHSYSNAQQKLSAFLLELKQRISPNSSDFDLPMTHSDIANYLGLTPETISRLLHKMQSHNILTIHQRKLSIHSLQLLKQIKEGLPYLS